MDRKTSPKNYLAAFVSIGILLSAASLLKIPAMFDFLGMLVAIYVITLSELKHLSVSEILRQTLFYVRKVLIPISLPTIVIFTATVLYFHLNHALPDFLTASFSQNASYVAVGSGPFSRLGNPLFIKAFLLLVSSGILSILFLKKFVSKELLFLSLWFGFSLYGALLSSRPYMHYLLQIVPPVILLFFYLVGNIRKYSYILITYFLLTFALIRMFSGAFALEPISYYQNWFNYISERKSWEDYVNYFDSRTLNSYAIAAYLKENTAPTDPIFVWGDASFVYVLSNRPAVTKFIQAHHLTTIDPKNYDLVIQKLEAVKPKYILISRPVHFAFPALESLVRNNYRPTIIFQDMYTYHLSSPK